MKYTVTLFFLFSFFRGTAQLLPKTQNIFIVTIDGVRWQEIFKGTDPDIINNNRYTSDIELAKLMYLDSSPGMNRKKLLPFFWNVLEKGGQLYGNRLYNNRVNVSNVYKFSYPGYNEIFTGYPDLYVSSNEKKDNLNTNVLEYLNSFSEFKDRIAAFTSWNTLSYILNKDRNGLPIYSGYDSIEENNSLDLHLFNAAQAKLVNDKKDTRLDVSHIYCSHGVHKN